MPAYPSVKNGKPQAVSRLAPAKINLALHVTGRRDDGYHLLDMLVVFADHGDTIRVEAAQTDRFSVSGPFASGIPANGDNLVLKARDALRHHAGRDLPPVAIHLEKNLPIASGIGGGSSDAAATLLALNAHWQLDVGFETLATIGLMLGADLPMCLHGAGFGTPLLAKGIGENLSPIRLPSLSLLLINDGTAIATPDVFRALTSRNNPPLPPVPESDVPDSDLAGLYDWLFTTRNDLLPATLTLAPQIAERLDLLRDNGALYAQMSGSGATCFGIFASAGEATHAAETIRSAHPDWFVAATQTSGF